MIHTSNKHFNLIAPPAGEWLALRLRKPGRTLALAVALAGYGAWVPTWKVSKQLPRRSVWRKVTEACVPGYVFVPAWTAYALPLIPKIEYSWMREPDGRLSRIPDHQFNALRKIADRPVVAASKLPKPGSIVVMPDGPWQGLKAKVITCNHRYAKLVVLEAPASSLFSEEIELPSCLLVNERT